MDRLVAASVSIVTHYILFRSAWDTGWLKFENAVTIKPETMFVLSWQNVQGK